MSSLFALLFMGVVIYLVFHGNQRDVRKRVYTDMLNGMIAKCDDLLDWCSRTDKINFVGFTMTRAVWVNESETAAAWHAYFHDSLKNDKAIGELERACSLKSDAVERALKVIAEHFNYACDMSERGLQSRVIQEEAIRDLDSRLRQIP